MVIIIGAGPIGIATGIQLKLKNIPFLILEKGSLVNSIFHYPVKMTFFSTSERLEIGNVPFVSHGPKPTRSEALEYYRRVAEHYELPVRLYEEVRSISGSDGNFTVKTDKNVYSAEKIVVATGFYGTANMLNVPGENLPKVSHYYREPHPYAWKNVLVVGAGNSATQTALECLHVRANVTMVVRKDQIKPTVKYWIKPNIENRIKEGSIKAFFNTTVKEITEETVILNTPDGELTLQNDYVLALTGYHPNIKLMERFMVELAEDGHQAPVYDEISQENKRKGIYVAGVVCGGRNTSKFLIENTRVHAIQIANHIAKNRA